MEFFFTVKILQLVQWRAAYGQMVLQKSMQTTLKYPQVRFISPVIYEGNIWTIESVESIGFFSSCTATISNWFVYLYNDTDGPTTPAFYGISVVSSNSSLILPAPLPSLTPGKYWISIIPSITQIQLPTSYCWFACPKPYPHFLRYLYERNSINGLYGSAAYFRAPTTSNSFVEVLSLSLSSYVLEWRSRA